MAPRQSQHGAALIDLIVATAVCGVVAGVSLPRLHTLRDRAQVQAAARYLAAQFHHARSEALRRNVCLAFRVSEHDGRYTLTLHADGDGDGVSESDIATDTDFPMAPGERIEDHFAEVSLDVPHDLPEIDGRGLLVAGSSPVRIGASRLITFTPLGNTTSGTLYLAGSQGTQAAVRLLGATGRIRALWYDTVRRSWSE